MYFSHQDLARKTCREKLLIYDKPNKNTGRLPGGRVRRRRRREPERVKPGLQRRRGLGLRPRAISSSFVGFAPHEIPACYCRFNFINLLLISKPTHGFLTVLSMGPDEEM